MVEPKDLEGSSRSLWQGTIRGIWHGWNGGRGGKKPEPENRAPAYLLNVSTKHYLSTTLLRISWLLDLEVNTYDAWLACDFAFYTKGSQHFNFKKKLCYLTL